MDIPLLDLFGINRSTCLRRLAASAVMDALVKVAEVEAPDQVWSFDYGTCWEARLAGSSPRQQMHSTGVPLQPQLLRLPLYVDRHHLPCGMPSPGACPQMIGGLLSECRLTPLQPVRLSPEPRGILSNLKPLPIPGLDAPTSHEVAMSVSAVGLNFRYRMHIFVAAPWIQGYDILSRLSLLACRDVLNVLGMYPGDPGPPGGDCAGRITAAGGDGYHV